jgi:hypothetical protein
MKCGFYETDITPPLGSDLPGYYKHRYATGVEDKLFAKAVVFAKSDNKSEQSALVIIDCVELDRKYCDAIIKRASEFTGIPENNISVSATHSHYGIPSGDDISDTDEVFMSVFVKLAADAITLAQQRLTPCTLHYAKGKVEGVSQVRDMKMKNGDVYTNVSAALRDQIVEPYSEPDPELPVIFVRNENGENIGALYSFACHCDCLAGRELISGDYASAVSDCLKNTYGQNFVSIYLAGASGDINARLANANGSYKRLGEIIAEEIVKISDKAQIMSDSVAVAKRAIHINRRRATKKQVDEATWISEDPINRAATGTMLPQLASLLLKYHNDTKDLPDEVEIILSVYRIGDAYIFASPGELYHQFGQRLKDGCPSGKGLISELSHMTGGYIALPELFDKNLYTIQLCNGAYLSPEAGDIITETMLEMAKELA